MCWSAPHDSCFLPCEVVNFGIGFRQTRAWVLLLSFNVCRTDNKVYTVSELLQLPHIKWGDNLCLSPAPPPEPLWVSGVEYRLKASYCSYYLCWIHLASYSSHCKCSGVSGSFRDNAPGIPISWPLDPDTNRLNSLTFPLHTSSTWESDS